MMGPLSPPPTSRTPVASFGLMKLEMRCDHCGPRIKEASELIAAVGPHREIGEVFPRLTCGSCKRKLSGLIAISDLAVQFGREPLTVDVTEFLEAANAA